MSEVLDLLRECSQAGIVFHPRGGKLRPEMTAGPVEAGLRRRVEEAKSDLLDFFSEAFDWYELDVCHGGDGGFAAVATPMLGSSR